MDRRRRATVALTLNFLSLLFSITAFSSSYWCQGTRKVPKPFCTGKAGEKQAYCITFNNSDSNDSNVVQYTWETGDDKFIERYFHAGIWYSCEETISGEGEKCRSFITLTPPADRGVLWLSIVASAVILCFSLREPMSVGSFVIYKVSDRLMSEVDSLQRYSLYYLRSAWNGRPYDVHNCISNDSQPWSRRLETSELGLWMVLLPCVGLVYLLYGCVSDDYQQIHKDHFRIQAQAEESGKKFKK
ncbi:hypothetical protein FKM82_007798 [Ascaphus truei]